MAFTMFWEILWPLILGFSLWNFRRLLTDKSAIR